MLKARPDPRPQVHKLCQSAAPRILADFKPNLMIAIGGGGYVPARILRSFLRQPGAPNIPIQAIGLSLYESLGTAEDAEVEAPGTKVTRTQWLDLSSLEMANLIGKHVLIVDEVDDTRTTLEYAVRELEKDVAVASEKAGRQGEQTRFSIFVLHNKDKVKKGRLPEEMMQAKRYLAAVTVGDEWINYPWEATCVSWLWHPDKVWNTDCWKGHRRTRQACQAATVVIIELNVMSRCHVTPH